MRIVDLCSGVASTSAVASSVVSSSCMNLLVASEILVIWCSRDPFNGSFEVGAGRRRVETLSMEFRRDPDFSKTYVSA